MTLEGDCSTGSSLSATTRLVLACLAGFLVVFPLTIQKPGLPLTLKADEAAYYLMAESLAHDRDLKVESQDLTRLFDHYPVRPAKNVILMSDDGWATAHYGKPYIYSLFATPWVWAFGPNGMVAFNMAMLLACVWLGAIYLGRFNSPGLSLTFAAGFFLASSAFAYVFWLHPEIFNLTAIAACLFLAFHDFRSGPGKRGNAWIRYGAPAASGAVLALAVYNKPMYAALGVAALFRVWRGRGLRSALVWVLAAALSMSAICGVSIAFSGHPSAYLGVSRAGVTLHTESLDDALAPMRRVAQTQGVAAPAVRGNVGDTETEGETTADEAPSMPRVESKNTNSWGWIFKPPPIRVRKLVEETPYFLWGRHVGLFPYLPFAAIALLLFLFHSRRYGDRWLLLACVLAIAVYTMLWVWFNWHGGGGFVGNRYFVSVYPAFLFLITRIRPKLLTVVGYALAGLLVGGIAFTPFGSPVREPTLQSHVRYAPFRWFPFELSIRGQIPGYRGVSQQGLYFLGREDVFRPHGHWMWMHAGQPVEVFVFSWEPIEETSFLLRSYAVPNRINLRFGGEEQTVVLDSGKQERIVVRPTEPYKIRWDRNLRLKTPQKQWVYRLLVDSEVGAFPPAGGLHPAEFRVGALLLPLGAADNLDRDLFHARWKILDAPELMEAGDTVPVEVVIHNVSDFRWPHRDTLPVVLSYHWLTADGEDYVWEHDRTFLPHSIEPDRMATVTVPVVVPDEPGDYLLQFDAVRERAGWFSRKNPASIPDPIPVTVTPGTAVDATGEEVEAPPPTQ